MAEHNELGAWGEEVAAIFLQRKGYLILERNWRMGHRDLDIVALDGQQLVFVEVKTRRNRIFTEPELAVDHQKLHNLTHIINQYIKYKNSDYDYRIDVIGIVALANQQTDIKHIIDIPTF